MGTQKLVKPGQTAKMRRLSPEASKQAALEAARLLLIEAGPQAVTLKAVAHRVGRTHANLLHHFGSAAELQIELARYLAETVCARIGEAVAQMTAGEVTSNQLADLIFDSFDKEGAGALASWMLLSGNDDALTPIVETIHRLVDEISEEGHADQRLHELTLEMVLLALGDSLMGGPLCASLGIARDSARQIASRRLQQSLEEQQKLHSAPQA